MSSFQIGRLNHVGIAVPNLQEAIETYDILYGVSDIVDPFDLLEQKVKVCFVNLPNSQIELIEPLGTDGPLTKFLQQNPKGGQHHVCFEVDDIEQANREMKNRGATVLGVPRIGAHGTPVIFVHPKNSNGVLIELMEIQKH